MRSRRNIVAQLKRLTTEQKLMLTGAGIAIVGCFLPWYGISSRVVNEWWSGFGNIGSIGGYSISLLAFGIMAITLLPALEIKVKLPWTNEKMCLAMAGEMLLFSMIFMVVYAQYAIYDSPNSSTRFGLYVTIVASVITFLGAWANVKSTETSYIGFNQPELARVPRVHKALEERMTPQAPTESRREERYRQTAPITEPQKSVPETNHEERYGNTHQQQKPQSFNF